MLQVEVRTADNSRQITEARQNALYGLNIALGELQALAGPDQRVTGTATLARDSAGTQWEPANVSATSPHRNWTGVWDSSAPRVIPDASIPGKVSTNISNDTTKLNPLNPEPIAWLVSGGKNRKTATGVGNETTNVTPTSYPARISIAGKPTSVATVDDHVILLGNGTVNLVTNPEDGIVVPKVAIMKPNASGGTSKVGSYAYWVADEGVKARFDAVESSAFTTTENATIQKDYRVLGAQRIGAEQMSAGNSTSTFGTLGYDPASSEFRKKARSISDRAQIGFLDADQQFHAAAKTRFHDLTTVSEGVLSDPKKGGLKQDLTVYLQQGPIAGLISDNDILFSDSRDISSVASAANPRAPVAVRYPGFQFTGTGLPTFGLLKSWYQMDAAAPQITQRTATQHGLYPVITRCEWPIWIDVNLTLSVYPYTVPDTAFIPRIYPTITLWNPYNVDLPAQDYKIEISVGSDARVGFWCDPILTATNNPVDIMQGPSQGDPRYFDIPSKITLKIPKSEGAIPPGQTKVYTLSQNYTTGATEMELLSNYFSITPVPDWWSSTTADTKGTNPNNSFGLGNPKGGAQLVIPSDNFSGQRTLFRLAGYFPNDTLNDHKRIVTLSNADNNQVLQILTPDPKNYHWLDNGNNGPYYVRYTIGSGITFNGTNSFSFNTRRPVRSWQIRPINHYVSGAFGSNRTGGSFSSMLDYNYRVSKVSNVKFAAGPPPIDIGGREETQWSGPYRTFPDGNISDGLNINHNLYIFPNALGDGVSERFFYSYPDTVWENAENKTNALISSAFGVGGSLSNAAPLFDLKPSGREILSLGYLQHVNLASYVWQPSYILGNSWVNSQLAGRDRYSGLFSGNPAPLSDTENQVYDISFLVNDAIWDRFYLSSSNSTVTQNATLLANTKSLPNSRLHFREQNGGNYTSLTTAVDKCELGAAFFALHGAFNVNSTSVEAWKAFLSSRNGLVINTTTANATESVFSRMLHPGGTTGGFLSDPASGQPAAELGAAYTGARKLSAPEISVLAEKIVEQVKLRGPFTSLSDFVNRRLTLEPALTDVETAVSRTGFLGPLQAAIDAASEQYITNNSSGINSRFYQSTIPGSYYKVDKIPVKTLTLPYSRITSVSEVATPLLKGFYVPKLRMLGKSWYYSAAGIPGFLTQADMLSALGHLMTVRSDTFTIRSYGESLSSSGKILAKAWCEAVVQRIPDPVKSNPSRAETLWPDDPANITSDPVNALGRKFIIKSFRWLAPEEI